MFTFQTDLLQEGKGARSLMSQTWKVQLLQEMGVRYCWMLPFGEIRGMTAEEFIVAWIKSEILYPKHLTFQPVNLYYEVVKEQIAQNEKDACGKGKRRLRRLRAK